MNLCNVNVAQMQWLISGYFVLVICGWELGRWIGRSLIWNVRITRSGITWTNGK
jgi:hypothetical protein